MEEPTIKHCYSILLVGGRDGHSTRIRVGWGVGDEAQSKTLRVPQTDLFNALGRDLASLLYDIEHGET